MGSKLLYIAVVVAAFSSLLTAHDVVQAAPALWEEYPYCAVSGAQPGEAVVVNVTPVDSAGAGFGTVGPTSVVVGSSSLTNTANAEARPNLGIVPVKDNGGVCYGSNQNGHVIMDVFGFLPSFRPANADLTARRILDTRQPSGPTTGNKLAANTTVCAPSGAQPGEAVVVNVTPVDSAGPGFGTVGPTGVVIGSSSLTNTANAEARPNLGVIPVKADGNVCYGSDQNGHVIMDVFGFLPSFRPANADLTARRILDTRQPSGPTTGNKLAANTTVCAPSGAQPGEAVVVNVTPVDSAGPGFGTVGPTGVVIGSSSLTNTANAEARPNLGVIPVKADGNVCYGSDQNGHVIMDVFGFLPSFRPANADLTARRILDTRRGPSLSGGIDGISVIFNRCNYRSGYDELQFTNVSSEPIVIVRPPTSLPTTHWSFEWIHSGSNLQTVNPGATTSIFRSEYGDRAVLSSTNRAGTLTVDFSPCGSRLEDITPNVTGTLMPIVSMSVRCIGPDDGTIEYFSNLLTPPSTFARVDTGNNGSVELTLPIPDGTYFAFQPQYLSRRVSGDLFSMTIDGLPGKMLVDYGPCRVLPPGHNGNIHQRPF